jgi:hypothetical protein
MYLLTDGDVQQIRSLLSSKRHRHAEVLALLRTLVVSEQAAVDPMREPTPPTDGSSASPRGSRGRRTGRRSCRASRG